MGWTYNDLPLTHIEAMNRRLHIRNEAIAVEFVFTHAVLDKLLPSPWITYIHPQPRTPKE